MDLVLIDMNKEGETGNVKCKKKGKGRQQEKISRRERSLNGFSEIL